MGTPRVRTGWLLHNSIDTREGVESLWIMLFHSLLLPVHVPLPLIHSSPAFQHNCGPQRPAQSSYLVVEVSCLVEEAECVDLVVNKERACMFLPVSHLKIHVGVVIFDCLRCQHFQMDCWKEIVLLPILVGAGNGRIYNSSGPQLRSRAAHSPSLQKQISHPVQNKMTSQSKAIRIQDITVTGFKKSRLNPVTCFDVLITSGNKKWLLKVGCDYATSNEPADMTLERMSDIVFEVFHKGVFTKKLLGSLKLSGEIVWSFPLGIQKICLDLVTDRTSTQPRLMFYLDNLKDNDRTMLPTGMPLIDRTTPALVSSYTVDRIGYAIHSAHMNAEGITAYYKPMHQALCLVDQLIRAIDAASDIHFSVKAAWLALSSVYRILRQQTITDVSVKELAEAMVELFSWVGETTTLDHKIQSLGDTIKLMAQQTEECAMFIKDYTGRRFLGRTVHSNSNSVNETVGFFRNNFDALRRQFDTGVAVSTFTLLTRSDAAIRVVLDLLQVSQTREDRKAFMEVIEKGLPRVADASFDSTRICLKGTREDILDDIYAWSCDRLPGGRRPVYWLTAAAGAGKSTIAHSVAARASELGNLGGSFFLHRNYADRRNPRLIINTLAFRLAHFNLGVAEGIKKALDNDPDLGQSSALHIQFYRLIVEPIAAATLIDPILLVLDDLDALDVKDDGSRNARREFLVFIAKRCWTFPPTLKIFMTSRPESDICHLFKDIGAVFPKYEQTLVDIECLARSLLAEVADKFGLRWPWPDQDVLATLVKLAGELFIWIKAACLYIYQRDPEKRLQLILEGDPSHKSEAKLDHLYRQGLLNHVDRDGDDDLEFYDNFRKVLGCIAYLRDPLSPKAIDALLGLTIRSQHTIHSFESFLRITDDGLVRPVHPSFIEFLTDKHRCGNDMLFIGEEHQLNLARRCMALMLVRLKRNVCGLEDPCARNNTSSKRAIPEELHYCCRFWADHLQSLQPDDEFSYYLVEEFFSGKVLFWLEVMSLAGLVDRAILALDAAGAWVKRSPYKSLDLLSMISDTRRFVEEFRPILVKSAGHIYESALPLVPHNTTLFRMGSTVVGEPVPSVTGCYWHWEPHRIVEGRSGDIWSAAFSPDGTQCVFGTGGHAVFVCNAANGSFIGEALRGHSSPVTFVAFSPDGTKIFSASNDGKTCIWNLPDGVLLHQRQFGSSLDLVDSARSVALSPDGTKFAYGVGGHIHISDVANGTTTAGSLEGCQSGISSVEFSQDGTKVVSGSSDGTIQIWNSLDGTPMTIPLVGHRDVIYSTTFSPDGTRVASGSGDHTVRLWDATNGEMIGNPLIGHEFDVCSVVFSPDGQKIVSCSDDNTIRVWDTHHGTPIGKPLKKHMGPVHVVAFSPDQTKLVSGSTDSTICIWSATYNDLLGEPATGHSDRVVGVTFSPDGSKLISGSWDNTICVWDPNDGRLIGGPLQGHTDCIFSIAFSLDGTKFASASWDNTVCIWNAENHSMIGKPLKGHTGRVMSVAFSPDGTKVVSGSWDCTFRIWSVTDGELVGEPLRVQCPELLTISFSSDGTKILTSTGVTARLWDMAKRSQIGSPLQGHTDLVLLAVFTPDERQIITGSYDQKICIWNTTDQSLVGSFPQVYFESWRGTGPIMGHDQAIPASMQAVGDLIHAQGSIFPLLGGWVKVAETSKRCWIPPRYRGAIAIHSGRVCMGTSTGHIVIINMRRPITAESSQVAGRRM